MATLNLGSFDTGSVSLARIVDNYTAAYGYQATVSDGNGGTITNPETKAAFMKRKVGDHIRETAKGYEKEQAKRTAESSVTEITLT